MCGSCFFSAARSALLHLLLVFNGLDVILPHVANRAGQESARAAGRIEQDLARVRIEAFGHEGCYGARGVVLAGVAGALQVVEDLLVDFAEVLLLDQVVEVDLVDPVDDLPHQLARLHVVVGILEDVADHAAPIAGCARHRQGLERGEELVVDERHQRLASYAFRIGCPRLPLHSGRDRRPILRVQELELAVLVVDDLQEEHPAELRDALGIAIDARILAHDVLDGFDGVPNRHRVLCSSLVQRRLHFVDGALEIKPAAELSDQLQRRSH